MPTYPAPATPAAHSGPQVCGASLQVPMRQTLGNFWQDFGDKHVVHACGEHWCIKEECMRYCSESCFIENNGIWQNLGGHLLFVEDECNGCAARMYFDSDVLVRDCKAEAAKGDNKGCSGSQIFCKRLVYHVSSSKFHGYTAVFVEPN